jgi:hypothetical protein
MQAIMQSDSGLRGSDPAISRIRADFVQVRKTIIGATRSVPPHYLYRVEGYDYSITIEILQQDTAPLVGSYGIVCFLPDGSIRKFPIVEGNLSSRSPEISEYSLPLEIQARGLHRFLLAHSEDFNSNRHPRHYQNVSNTQSVYLETPSD